MRVSRWRCLNRECERETFTDQLPEIVCPHARRTQRIAQLVHLFGHGSGGRPAERLMKRLGMPVSDDTILRHLKRQVARLRAKTTVHVAGVDDWSWRKGRTYGTIIVDLERREVIDVLQDRTTTGTAGWLGQHPEVEIVSRDRCGLYAQGAHEGAPQARQVADGVLAELRRRLGFDASTTANRHLCAWCRYGIASANARVDSRLPFHAMRM
jgi:transposase